MTIAVRKTPGVYITEREAFLPSIASVPTAIPAFIGYTEKAEADGKSILLRPQRVDSMVDYEAFFGAGYKAQFSFNKLEGQPKEYDFSFMGGYYELKPQDGTKLFKLYNSLRAFYANGGATCYIVSVGIYGTQAGSVDQKISKEHLLEGLSVLEAFVGPTILAMPDAVLLEQKDCYDVYQKMLVQCSTLQDRIALLDVPQTENPKQSAVVDAFRGNIGSEHLGYGVAYYPFIKTTVVSSDEVSYENFGSDLKILLMGNLKPKEDEIARLRNNLTDLEKALPKPESDVKKWTDSVNEKIDSLKLSITQGQKTDKKYDIAGAIRKLLEEIERLKSKINPAEEIKKLEREIGKLKADIALLDFIKMPGGNADRMSIKRNNENLIAQVDLTAELQKLAVKKLNLLPPSGAIAGLYAYSDRTRGVWNAPANLALKAVVAPSFNITDAQQQELNVPTDGKAINAIRYFVGRGTLVWGARTLQGNSDDWRYIQVRRSLIYIEQSIKQTLATFVFAPNDGKTWVAVTAMISSFLQEVWNQGGLLGATAQEAFSVTCGLGSTMTAKDVLEGHMIVQVKLQMLRPAEFIELTFEQTMGES
ncbi:MAG TPA: phage tail sheath C-terminal domain-containing protein [Dongiaceae bacterium]|jgi:hypothetical protein|nr:phage tail sheath C-terminal domain-containing protein [Dongiaceae bacterium]